jgi:hypothetical protein
MKTSILKPTVDFFTIPSLASLARKKDATLPRNTLERRAVGLSTADISQASEQVSLRHGLTVSRSPQLRTIALF